MKKVTTAKLTLAVLPVVLLASFVLSFLTLSFILPLSLNTSSVINPPPDNGTFIIGAMANASDNFTYINNPDVFNMNLWHTYVDSKYNPVSKRHYPTGWNDQDSLFAIENTYAQLIKDKLESVGIHNMKALMLRPKIEWLCYGHRSEYQCESEQNVDAFYWFYSFNNNAGGQDVMDQDPNYGNNHWVRFLRMENSTNNGNWTDQQGTVISRLKANNEQSNKNNVNNYEPTNDDSTTWFVKPNIRIDRDFANNPNNFNKLVCRVDVYDVHGFIQNDTEMNRIKSFDIRVRNFRPLPATDYDGHYLEEFYFSQHSDTSRQDIFGAWNPYIGNKWPRGRVDDEIADTNMNRVDIRVYWYGEADMWLDYIRVDDEIADQLFKDERDDWLHWEAQIADASTSAYKFYIEEFEFNNVPCISYVNQKLKDYTNTSSADMMVCFYWQKFTNHLNEYWYRSQGKWGDNQMLNWQVLNKTLVQDAGITTFFTETYPFPADISRTSKLPSSLNLTLPNDCILATTTGPSAYDDWLQVQLDNPYYPAQPLSGQYLDAGWQGWNLRMMNDLARNCDIPFINMPQVHLWANWNVEVRREPTNEELKLQSYLSLAYGAKGLIYFWYSGSGTCGPSTNFNKGFLDSDNPPVRRQTNAYGQKKWDTLISIHQKIKKWAPYLMSFDNGCNSYIYHVDHLTCSTNTFITDIKTSSPDIQDWIYDQNNKKYLQLSIFNNPDEQYTKYFMLVNRRCSPYINESSPDNYGGKRHVEIKFNADKLPFFTNWKIYDLENNTYLMTISKTDNQYKDFGYLLPGDGKLYKMVPVN
jgi:hypothetical protein